MAFAAAIPAAVPRTALVIGGARGIGRAIALALADAGFSVAVHYHTSAHGSAADAGATAEEIRGRGVAATVLPADLADEAAVERLVPAAAALGPLGVLVNNASVFLRRDEWHDATRAPFLLIQRFAAALPTAAEGAVINLLDQRARSPAPQFITGSVSSAGWCALTQAMALALAPRIRVNGIGPGPALPGTGPDEVARAVLALLALPSVTGQMLALDGGQHLQWTPATEE
jgi:NAD(P)-dependent dehydrogenase (short-subunit alcohol dehydrogenase family)